jgi:hypothetical protein
LYFDIWTSGRAVRTKYSCFSENKLKQWGKNIVKKKFVIDQSRKLSGGSIIISVAVMANKLKQNPLASPSNNNKRDHKIFPIIVLNRIGYGSHKSHLVIFLTWTGGNEKNNLIKRVTSRFLTRPLTYQNGPAC